MSATVAPRRELARFQLLRELGRGAQAVVWLAHDPRLDREVALKLLSADADESTRHEWLNEARAVSRLKHPNIVPVFEADEHAGQSYLVFEYVEGPTLQQQRRTKPQLPAREAVTLVMGVLDALAAAHEQGIVHRDLKPSNILLGLDGRPRVMDFGIAARVAQGDGRIVGTPGYMSPEAARGEAPLPAMDVFSAGVLLGELLAGAPLMRETDPYRAIARVQKEDLQLPATLKVDDTLRGIVQRALSRTVAERYDSARSLHTALAAWLTPQEQAVDSSHATLEFLLRRMRHKTDFPALSSSVVRIQRIAMSDTESVGRLTDEILRDVSLTNKLLRMVNTVHFTSVAGGGISTVSRAVALVGFAGIRNMALSVILLEHMGDKGHAALLKEEFLRALMSGTLASDLTPLAREAEEAFLAAMFQNLGRLLTEYYFPEEALQIRQRLAAPVAGRAPPARPTPEARDLAARKVLGLSFGELGSGVAKSWGLPDTLQGALRMPEGDVPARAIDRRADKGVERMRWLGRCANALSDALLSADGEEQTAALSLVAESYGLALDVQPREIVACVHAARTRVAQMAAAMGVHVAAGAPARRLLEATLTAPAELMGCDDKTLVTAQGAQLQLSQGLAEVREAVSGKSMRLNEVLNLVLETVHRSLEMRCVVFCLREPKSGHLIGRLSLGARDPAMAAAFRIAPEGGGAPDLFSAICAKGADLLISDAKTVVTRLPTWYRQNVDAGTFLLLPLRLKGSAIGMIYADKATAGAIVLKDEELALLKGLRDEAVAAFARGAG